MGHNVHINAGERYYHSAAAEASKVVVTGHGKLYHAVVYNKSGSTIYLLCFDATALPANGTAADFAPMQVPNLTWQSLDFVCGHPFFNGFVIAASSTDTTLTLAGNVLFNVVYA